MKLFSFKHFFEPWFRLMNESQLLSNALAALSLAWKYKWHLGQHMDSIPTHAIPHSFLLTWVGFILFQFAVGLVKASALFVYERIFETQNRMFQYSLWIMHALVVAWYLFAILVNVAGCLAVNKK